MLKQAIPVLHITNADQSEAFYCQLLGFRLEFKVPEDATGRAPCYMGVSRDGAVLHLSSHSGDGVIGGVVFFIADDVDALHAEFVPRMFPSTSPRWIRPGACASYMCATRMGTASASALR